ncbi:MAG TPA: ComEA family DNA-binding protein [Candidatus Woesebacteria bacterium]|nr:ComEA family DNA-binding protein [Candidatus Woesebacteria bacterium]
MEIKTIWGYLKNSTGLDRFLLGVIIVGLVVCSISVFRGILISRQVQVEYLSNGDVSSGSITKVYVDIEGAVVYPGVYELNLGSRIKDVLVLAGGLSESADRDFCEKNINMAEQIKDGQKIYIPSGGNSDADRGYFEASIQSKKISINTASISELDTLWGIGESRAESIVKNRPYQSVDDLVTKGVLPSSILERNRELLSVF